MRYVTCRDPSRLSLHLSPYRRNNLCYVGTEARDRRQSFLTERVDVLALYSMITHSILLRARQFSGLQHIATGESDRGETARTSLMDILVSLLRNFLRQLLQNDPSYPRPLGYRLLWPKK